MALSAKKVLLPLDSFSSDATSTVSPVPKSSQQNKLKTRWSRRDCRIISRWYNITELTERVIGVVDVNFLPENVWGFTLKRVKMHYFVVSFHAVKLWSWEEFQNSDTFPVKRIRKCILYICQSFPINGLPEQLWTLHGCCSVSAPNEAQSFSPKRDLIQER